MTGVAPEVRMATDIARQFQHLPEERATEEIATHIEKFWTPWMQLRLVQIVDPEDPDIDPLVVHAASRLVVEDLLDREELTTPAGG